MYDPISIIDLDLHELICIKEMSRAFDYIIFGMLALAIFSTSYYKLYLLFLSSVLLISKHFD